MEFLLPSQPGHRPSCPLRGSTRKSKPSMSKPLPLLGSATGVEGPWHRGLAAPDACAWGLGALRSMCWMPGPLPKSGLEPLSPSAHWLQVVKTQANGTRAPGCRGGTVHSTRTLLLLQGASQPAGRLFCPPLCGRPRLPTAWERGWQRLREGRAGVCINGGRAVGLAAPLAEPQRPVCPGQPQALAEASAHLLEFQRQML